MNVGASPTFSTLITVIMPLELARVIDAGNLIPPKSTDPSSA
jgi:hypothetical protein